MSYTAVKWAFKQDVSPQSTKLVLVALAHHADPKTGECFPDKTTLQKECGLSRRAVMTALAQLRDEGHIIDTGERRGRTGQIIVYRVDTDKGANAAPLKGANYDTEGAHTAPLEGGKGANYDTKGGKFCTPSIDERLGKDQDDDDEARAKTITEKFFELRRVHWPEREPCLTPTMTIETEARQFLQAGGTVELACEHLEAQMPRVAARGRSPPNSLKFFQNSLQDVLAQARNPITFQSKPNGAAKQETEDERRKRIIEMANNGN